MAKAGRNDRSPCGSGKKYKACCLAKDEAAECEELAKAQVGRDERAAERRQSLREVREAPTARLAGHAPAADIFDDGVMQASNAALRLVHEGRFD